MYIWVLMRAECHARTCSSVTNSGLDRSVGAMRFHIRCHHYSAGSTSGWSAYTHHSRLSHGFNSRPRHPCQQNCRCRVILAHSTGDLCRKPDGAIDLLLPVLEAAHGAPGTFKSPCNTGASDRWAVDVGAETGCGPWAATSVSGEWVLWHVGALLWRTVQLISL